MRVVLMLTWIAVAPGVAFADEATCSKIPADLDRLACYDRESGTTPVVHVENTAATAWQVQTEVSKLTDKKTVFLTATSQSKVTCSWNSESDVWVMIRCEDGITSAIISSSCHMVSSPYNDYGKIDYRVDDKPAKSVSMQESTSNKALGLWSGRKAIPFIKQMLGGKHMIVKFTPYGDNPVTAEFDISGIDEAIKTLRTECKW